MAKVKIQVYVQPKEYDHISRLAKKTGLKEHEITQNLINMGLNDALLLEKMGVLSVILKAGEIKNKLKKAFLSGKKEISIEDLKK